jgi:hypothetical protein
MVAVLLTAPAAQDTRVCVAAGCDAPELGWLGARAPRLDSTSG